MTANDNRHASEAGGGDQHQVYVEIKGVRDLDVVLLKMAGELEARAQRPPAKQALPHRKSSNRSELAGQRAAGVHASQMNVKFGCVGILCE